MSTASSMAGYSWLRYALLANTTPEILCTILPPFGVWKVVGTRVADEQGIIIIPNNRAIKEVVLGAGLEPAQPQWPREFKSLASTNFATRAINTLNYLSSPDPRFFRLRAAAADQP